MLCPTDRAARLKPETAAGVLRLKTLKEIDRSIRMGNRPRTQPTSCPGFSFVRQAVTRITVGGQAFCIYLVSPVHALLSGCPLPCLTQPHPPRSSWVLPQYRPSSHHGPALSRNHSSHAYRHRNFGIRHSSISKPRSTRGLQRPEQLVEQPIEIRDDFIEDVGMNTSISSPRICDTQFRLGT